MAAIKDDDVIKNLFDVPGHLRITQAVLTVLGNEIFESRNLQKIIHILFIFDI